MKRTWSDNLRLFMLMTLCSFVLVSSCGKKEGGATNTASDAISENITDPVTIDFWQFWTDPTARPIVEKLVADFHKQNPLVTVNLTDLTWENGREKIVIALASGSGPDLMELGSDWVPEFAGSGRVADLSKNFADSKGEYIGWEPVTSGDKVYGAPWILGTRALFYNTDLLRRAGYSDSIDNGRGGLPYKIDDFKNLVFRVDALGKDIYGWGSNAAEKNRLYKKFLPFFWSYGASFYSENDDYCVISSMKAINALKLYQVLNDSCGYVETQRRIEDAFLDGKIGVILSGDWLIKRIKTERPNFHYVTGVFPGLKVNGQSFLGGEYLCVNAQSSSVEKAAAVKLAKFFLSPQSQVEFCKGNFSTGPASLEAAKDSFFTSDLNILTFVKQLRLSKAPPFEPTWARMQEEFERAVERTLFEGVAPAQALYDARNAIQKISRPADSLGAEDPAT